MLVQANALPFAYRATPQTRGASSVSGDVFTPSEPLPPTLRAKDAMALLAKKDEVFPPVQAELVIPGPDGPLTVTKVPTRPSLAGKALEVGDSQVFLERDQTRNYIRRVDNSGTMVFSEEFSQGFNVKWKGHDGERLYVQLHGDRERSRGPNLFALDLKTGKVLASKELHDDPMMSVAPGGGLFAIGSGLEKLNQDLEPVESHPSRVYPYKSRALSNGSTVIHNQRSGSAVGVIDARGRELFSRETFEYESPLLCGTDLWLIDGGSALKVDTATGKVRTLPAPGASAILPRPDGSYVTVSGDKYRFGNPGVEVRNADGKLEARVSVVRSGGLEQIHESEGEVLLVVRHRDEHTLYRLPLDGTTRQAEELLTLSSGASSTRMIPARLQDGRYLVFTPEKVTLLPAADEPGGPPGGHQASRHYASAAEAARDLGPAFSFTTKWWQGSVERPFLSGPELLGQVARAFPYGVPSDPSQTLSPSDDCINVVRPGGTLEEPRKASPLPLETSVEGKMTLKYFDTHNQQYVSFGKTSLHLPKGVRCTAMLPVTVGGDDKALVGTDQGLVYYADTAIRNHSVHVTPHVFDLGAPVAEIRKLEDGRLQALGEGGQVLTVNPRLHQAFSLRELKERTRPDLEIELGTDGVQIGGIYLPIEA